MLTMFSRKIETFLLECGLVSDTGDEMMRPRYTGPLKPLVPDRAVFFKLLNISPNYDNPNSMMPFERVSKIFEEFIRYRRGPRQWTFIVTFSKECSEKRIEFENLLTREGENITAIIRVDNVNKSVDGRKSVIFI